MDWGLGLGDLLDLLGLAGTRMDLVGWGYWVTRSWVLGLIMAGGSQIVDGRSWTVDGGFWIMSGGSWNLGDGIWVLGDRFWSMGDGMSLGSWVLVIDFG